MAFCVVAQSDSMRSSVENLIRSLYWGRYGASLSSLPATLVAACGPSGEVECAAGIRFGYEGLFSECYLDWPVDQALSRRFGRSVDRNRVIEVCSLAARSSRSSRPFVRSLIEFAVMADAEWAIFTATRSLRALLQRSGLNMIEIAKAQRSQVKNPDDWGSYYEHDPRVMAVSHVMASGHRRPRTGPSPLGIVADA
jgi:hypothetical protein